MRPVLVYLLAAVSIVAAPSGSAATFTVGSGAGCSHGSLDAAVFAALLNGAGADQIRVVTSTSSGGALVISGQLSIDGSYASCDATAPTPGRRAVVFGNGDRSVLHVSGGSVDIRNLSVTGGGTTARNSAGEYVDGGALHVSGGTVTLTDVNFYANKAQRGGAIAVSGAASMLRMHAGPVGTTIRDNLAEEGGGIFVDRGAVRADNRGITIRDNVATGDGGGIAMRPIGAGTSTFAITWPDGDPGAPGAVLDGFRVWANRARSGGGIHLSGSSVLSAAELWVANNLADSNGGGVNVYSGASFDMRRRRLDEPERAACGTIHGCNRITGNTAFGSGGGLMLFNGSAHLGQVLLAGNDTLDRSGGSAIGTGAMAGTAVPNNTLTLESVVVARNRCVPGSQTQSGCATIDLLAGENLVTLSHLTLAGNEFGAATRRAEIQGGRGSLSLLSSIVEPGIDAQVMSLQVPARVDCVMAPSALGTRPLAVTAPFAFVDRNELDYRVMPLSPAIDACDASQLGDLRVGDPGFRAHGAIDDLGVANRLGMGATHDVGAFEMAWPVTEPFVFSDGFE